jgi:dTDP-4-dehydrorhamnose reductase
MIILVGSKGYLGLNLFKILKKNFKQVLTYENIKKYNKLIVPSCVIYLARPGKDESFLKKFLKKILILNSKVKFIYVSSVSVYGDGSINKIVNLNSKFNPQSYYGLKKYKEELEIKKLKLIYKNFLPIILRCPTIYSNDKKNKHNFFNNLIKLHLPLPLRISSNKRSYLYLENFCSFIVFLIKQNIYKSTFLLCEKKNLSTESIVRRILIKERSKSFLFRLNKHFFYFLLFLIKKEELFKKIYGNFEINPFETYISINWRPKSNF